MMPLPPPLGSGELRIWRLDRTIYASTWNTGEGSFRAGGRWNSRGRRAIYASLDPSTAILEVAVHKTFRVLDTVPHVMTSARITDPKQVLVLDGSTIPNSNWLVPGVPSAGQQAFGDQLLDGHHFVVLPSVVSNKSWNVLFEAGSSVDLLDLVEQETFALDTRLHHSSA